MMIGTGISLQELCLRQSEIIEEQSVLLHRLVEELAQHQSVEDEEKALADLEAKSDGFK